MGLNAWGTTVLLSVFAVQVASGPSASPDDFRIRPELKQTRICMEKSEGSYQGKWGIHQDSFMELTLKATLLNQSSRVIELSGFEIYPDYGAASSNDAARNEKFDRRTNTDYFSEMPEHLANQVKIRVAPSSTQLLGEHKFRVYLDERDLKSGEHYLVFWTGLEGTGMKPYQFPSIPSEPLLITIPAKEALKPVFKRISSQLKQVEMPVCEDFGSTQ